MGTDAAVVAPLATASAQVSAAFAPDVACTHCGLPVPSGLFEPGEPVQFCCAGCRAAYGILRGHGLDQYYRLAERREAPVRPSGRSYDEFDHAAFQSLYVTPRAGGLRSIELYLEGVHCGSCVWLVERVPLIVPGVARAELNIRRSLATIEWNPRDVSLSAIARSLDTLGYPAYPYRGVKRDAMRRREDRAMLTRIGVAGAIAINVMLASLALYSGHGTMEPEWRRLFRWVSLIVVTPAMIWPARVFFTGALGAMRARALNMDVPIALGLAAGYLRGAMNTIGDAGPIYFDGLATLIFALLVGRYIQQRGQRAAADSAELLYALTPTTARLVTDDGAVHDLPTDAVVPGMLLYVRAGDTFPADGIVERGESSVDRSLLTGESRAERATVGTRVFAGTVNVVAGLRVRVSASGEESRVAGLMRQVEESAQRRAPIVQTANRYAAHFVAVVLVVAAATWVAWHFIDPTRAADNAIALLVVTCPCALALSTPLAISVAIGRAARRGILIRGGDALEQLARPAQIVLDKTGTITEGRPSLVSWRGSDWVKPYVLALEAHSSHPIADAFRRAWPRIKAADAEDVHSTNGGGIDGIVDRHRVAVGSLRFVASHSETTIAEFDHGEHTPVAVAVDGRLAATATIGDAISADAKIAIDALRTRGWRVSMLSGDTATVVTRVANELGVEARTGDASPEAKAAFVRVARKRGVSVVMVGDGINDAAAMAEASVGIGVRGGAEACLQTADVFLARAGLAPLVELADGAHRTMRVIRRNITFSLAYNVVGATLAVTGVLSPLVAAVLMPASSLTVVLASWRSHTFGDRSTDHR